MTTSYEKITKSIIQRPVLFIFNGGPGASSSPLHFSALGPMILKNIKNERKWSINENCPLPAADLVFIDPVGTGYTDFNNKRKATKYWDVKDDAAAITLTIKNWLQQHNRMVSPLLLVGESYGTVRAALILAASPEMNWKGLVLISPYLDRASGAEVPANDNRFIDMLPSMAAIAAFHHRNIFVEDPMAAYSKAARYALDNYSVSLLRGNTLTSVEKNKLADSLVFYTGLTKDYLIKANFRIEADSFQHQLLSGQNKNVGKLDGRVTQGTDHLDRRQKDPSLIISTGILNPFDHYYKSEFDYSGPHKFISLNLEVNDLWRWSDDYLNDGYWSVMPQLANKFKSDSQMKCLVFCGIYDLATPAYSSERMANHLDLKPWNLRLVKVGAGHQVYEGDALLSFFTREIGELIKDCSGLNDR